MNLPDLSIRRPIFITCVFILILGLGLICLGRLGIDLFPDVTFPVVAVTVTYPGAGPREVETLIAKPIEDELSTLSGIKNLSSSNEEGVATIIAEFNLDTDIRYDEQKVNDRISRIRSKLPNDIDDPVVRTFDPSDTPILTLALTAELPPARLYDLADQVVLPRLEQVSRVGLVEIKGGRKREIQVLLDENRLRAREVSATQVATQIGQAGRNTPAGKVEDPAHETLIRTLGDFQSISVIKDVVVKFVGNEVATRVGDVAEVRDGLEDEKNRTYIDGRPALELVVYRQSGANTVEVASAVRTRIARINEEERRVARGFELSVLRDGSTPIRDSVDDVSLTIFLGIALTVIVVLLFLGNIRSTLITGIALPNSLLGAFILMAVAGFTLNTMSLMALSLAVGLLIDDAIVVRENIFRRMELREKPRVAASLGAREVTLAVVATTAVVLSVFGPIAFLRGIVGQFFKQFGLTICFAMLISLLDSLTMAPMLSAYFASRSSGTRTGSDPGGAPAPWLFRGLQSFQRLQLRAYLRLLEITLRHPIKILGASVAIFLLSFLALRTVSKTFVPPQETGEFQVALDMPAGTSLEGMDAVARRIDRRIREHPEVRRTLITTGGTNGEPNEAVIMILLHKASRRRLTTTQMKDVIRRDMTAFSEADPKVEDISDFGGAPQQPFTVNIAGSDLGELQTVSDALLARLRKDPNLKDVDTSFRVGQPELEVVPDKRLSESFGILSSQVGDELRTLIEGNVPAKFRQGGNEYDIRVRLKPDQRNLADSFSRISVPNVNGRLIPLPEFSRLVETRGPSTINRQNRARYIQLSAEINPAGHGLGQAIDDFKKLIETGAVRLPPGVEYRFVGMAQDFQDLIASVAIALGLAILFIYLVLSSLYESFFIPFAIMLVLPLAACGAFYGLAIGRASLDIFSMIGCILLLGVATKNSILLVDHIQQGLAEGRDLHSAIIESGRVRFRPILMTSVALIAGMIPVAFPVTETARQRSSMGIAVIGGLITSTLLTLVVVPAAYGYLLRFQGWVMRHFRRFMSPEED